MKKRIYLIPIVFFLTQLHAQNIGIGTSSPTRAKLEVHGSVGATTAIFGGQSTGISLQNNWPGIGFNQYYNNGNKYIAAGFGAVQYFDPSSGTMALDMFGNGAANGNATTATRVFTIGNNGNVGIKIGPTDATLCVLKGTNPGGSAIFGGTSHNSHFNYSTREDTYIRAGRNNGYVYLNDVPGGHIIIGNGSSKVGINNGVPGYTLEIRQIDNRGLALINPNGFNIWELMNDAVAMRFLYNNNTSSFILPNGSYTEVSDSRLKKNVEQIPTVLNKIMLLQPAAYEMKYNNPEGKTNIGFIAQDVKKLFPELVHISKGKTSGYGELNDLHLMNYSGFGVLAIKGIQEQQQQLNEMKKEINFLKEQNKALLQLLNQTK